MTQAQSEAVIGNDPVLQEGANHPAVGVSWEDAQQLVEKINANLGTAAGGKMSLPTEAQYELISEAYPTVGLDK